jgi:DNA-binding GntR family transcriptional regulator
MKNSSPLLRESTSARLKTLILQRIIDGQYPAGHRLKELQLAREFNTSQAPVREALRELEATGVIESEPHRGSRVRTVSERELGEAYQVRAVLEQLAGELAAGQFSGRATLLQRQAERVRKAYEEGNVEEYARHDLAFHRMIVEAAGNQVLLENWDALHFDIRTRLFLGHSTTGLQSTLDLHDEIVEALVQGKRKLAGRLLRKHSEAFCLRGGEVQQGIPDDGGA